MVRSTESASTPISAGGYRYNPDHAQDVADTEHDDAPQPRLRVSDRAGSVPGAGGWLHCGWYDDQVAKLDHPGSPPSGLGP